MSENKIEKNEVEAAIEAGEKLVAVGDRISWGPGALSGENSEVAIRVPIALVPNGMRLEVMHELMKEADAREERPRALVGKATFSELDSFVRHALRFKDAGSAIFADAEKLALHAIYDYHEMCGTPRWCRHRSVYACPVSREWQTWQSMADRAMSQEQFAQLVEDHLEDVVGGEGYPAPASLLEMARNLAVYNRGTFERRVNPTTGEATLVVKDEHEPSSTKIPRAFLLGIPVFEAGALYRVEARIRFALKDSKPTFSYSLHRSADIIRDAFGEVRAKVATETGLPVLAGSPE